MIKIKKELLFVILLSIVYFVSLIFISREYRYLVNIALLITLLPFTFIKLKKIKKNDSENGTSNFNYRVVYMILLTFVLVLGFFLIKK